MLSQLEKQGISRKNQGHDDKNIKVVANTTIVTECLEEESTSKTQIPELLECVDHQFVKLKLGLFLKRFTADCL
ncbi:hypothetical protein HanHA89_Chr13g0502081 [Helianthus annuus]|nr:hypothetical protein HanHA89_Chr13g0502081 [Helianthus annuus]